MQIDSSKTYSPTFNAKIAQSFVSIMEKHFNSGQNRIQNYYKLQNKISAYQKYGYDNCTIELVKKYKAWGSEFSLVAVEDGKNISEGIVLDRRDSFRAIIQRFMKMNKHEFRLKMRGKK